MMICERCGKSFQERPNKDGSFNGFGLFREDMSKAVNVCAQCFNTIAGMRMEQIDEFLKEKENEKSGSKGVEDMPSGVPLTEVKYWAVKGAVANDVPKSEIQKKFKIGKSTIERVERTNNYQEFERERKERTRRANQLQKSSAASETVLYADDVEEPTINMKQDMHDIAREMANIRSILLRLVEAWEK